MTAQTQTLPRFSDYTAAWRFAYSQVPKLNGGRDHVSAKAADLAVAATQLLAPVLLAASVDGWPPDSTEFVLMNPLTAFQAGTVKAALERKKPRGYSDAIRDFERLVGKCADKSVPLRKLQKLDAAFASAHATFVRIQNTCEEWLIEVSAPPR